MTQTLKMTDDMVPVAKRLLLELTFGTQILNLYE